MSNTIFTCLLRRSLCPLFLGLAITSYGQTVSLGLASAAATPNSVVSLNLSAQTAALQPTGLEWTLSYSPTDLNLQSVTSGAAATAAGKTVVCNGATGTTICVAQGVNATPVADGVVATVTFKVAAAPSSSTLPIQVSNALAASMSGSAVASASLGSSITINKPAGPTLTGVSCAPGALTGAGIFSCSVALSAPAPAGGFAVSLNSNAAALTLPSALTILAGQSSSSFTAVAVAVAGTTPVTIVASSSAGVVSTGVTLNPVIAPSVTLSSVSCNSTSITSAAAVSCKVALSGVATSAASVALATSSPNLALPALVTVPSGASIVNFFAQAAALAPAGSTTTITATLNAKIATTTLTFGAAATIPSTTIRVKAGSGAMTDLAGSIWAADYGYANSAGVFTSTSAVTGSTDSALYQSERFGYNTMTYKFIVPNGNYKVTLKFAEISSATSGGRVFDVALNGAVVDPNLDVFTVAGGKNKALDRVYQISVVNNQVQISLTARKSSATISAIEILSN